jgi:two-component system response regulator FixJ
VDDDNAVRDALSLLLYSEDIEHQSYASAEDFLDQYAQSKLGCLLLDVRMPGMDGLELLDSLKAQNVDIPVIFMTGHGDVSLAVKAMKLGATDFIEKPFDTERLLALVRNCLIESLNINQTGELKQKIDERIAMLTKREKEVMELLVNGKQNKGIAQELGISPRTVELHRSRVMEKMQATSLSELVRAAMIVSEKK